MFKGLKALIAGVVAGTVVGVLFAPKKGTEIRKDLKKELDKGGLGVDTLKGVVTEMGKDMGETGHKVYEDVSKSETYKNAEKEIRKHAKNAKSVAKDLVKENIPANTRKKAKKSFLKAKTAIEKFGSRAKKGLNKVVSKVAEKQGRMSNKNPVIGIVGGQGRMGRLFVEFFEEKGLKVLIADLKTKLSNKDLVENSDIVIVSVPIDKTISVIKEILPYLKKGSAIADFTSVKERPVNEMSKAKNGIEVFGMHPMFGNSNPIPGQTILMCPTKKSGKYYKWMKEFLEKNGAIIKVMTPKEHDQIMAVAQDLIHFIEITCADGLRLTNLPVKEILPFISKASELKIMSSARILDQDAGLYGNMQIENPYNLKFLNNFKKTVEELIKIIEQKDLNLFKKYFAKTNKYLGKYAHEAYSDNSFLIDKLIEDRNRAKSQNDVKKEIAPAKKSIALLGPKHTFSDLAASKFLLSNKSNLKKYYTKNIEEVFELIEKGKVSKGILPIENKLDGTIRETLDNLFSKKVHIISSLNLPIHHCLAVLPFAKTSDIKKIISHEQALNQSRGYLKKHFPNISKETYPSTVSAVEKLIFSNDKSLAIISSKQAAEHYDLKIIAENIEDDSTNHTKFVVIEKGDYLDKKTVQKSSTRVGKTSVAFHFDKDSPGSLFSVLEEFAKAKINLTKIESRPTKKEFGDYIFYVDFDGSPNDFKVKEVFKKISSKVAKLKILGTY